MKQQRFQIDHIPALLLGEPSENVVLFLHGQGGQKEEAIRFAEVAIPKGWQVLGVDLPEHGERRDPVKLLPWNIVPELKTVGQYLSCHWSCRALRANSIGAWFGMLAFGAGEDPWEQSLFVSPVLDMERLITDMMTWAAVTEEQLQAQGEIPTSFGQTLSWEYLCYVRRHPISAWPVPAEILYGGQDAMIPQQTVAHFVRKNLCGLTVMEHGEHWFHTPEQLQFLAEWEKSKLSRRNLL